MRGISYELNTKQKREENVKNQVKNLRQIRGGEGGWQFLKVFGEVKYVSMKLCLMAMWPSWIHNVNVQPTE